MAGLHVDDAAWLGRGGSRISGRRRRRPRRSSSSPGGRAPRRRARGAPRFVSSSFVCERPRRLWTKSITVGTPARDDLGGVVERAARKAVRRSGDLADRLVAEADAASRRRGSARSSRSAPTRPRWTPPPRSARSPPSPRRASRRARCASRWRWSRSCSAVSTTEVTMPGLQTTPPVVQTAPPPVRRAISRISSASFAAPASASRRLSIGVEPACAAWPRQVIRWRSTPNVPRTTPSGRSERLEHRALLDVQLEVGGRALELGPRVERRSRSTPCAASASGSAMPSRVGELPQLVLVGHRARGCARAEEPAAEARAFLVGPVDEPHRDRRLALLGDPTQHLDAGDDVQASVEPAAVRHRVDVAADEDGALRVAAEREPLVPRLVDLSSARVPRACRAATRAPAPTSPSRRRAARRSRRRSAPGAPQLGDGSLRIERHGATLTAASGTKCSANALPVRQRLEKKAAPDGGEMTCRH